MQEMASIRPPKEFDISVENRCQNWELFQQTWLNYEIASGLNEKTENVRVATLLSVIGNDAIRTYNAFTWQLNEAKTVASILS